MTLTWPCLNKRTAHQLIILDIRAEIVANKYKRYRPNKFWLKLWPWHWTDLGQTLALHIVSSYLTFVQSFFVNPTRGIKVIERTRNTVIQSLILDCDIDLEPTLVKHWQSTSSHHTWHLCKVICKSHQGFKRYRADTKYSHTLFILRFWPWPWTDLGQTLALHIVASYLTFVQRFL